METKSDRLRIMSAWAVVSVPSDKELVEWFKNHSEMDYSWYQTGCGSMFRKRNFICSHMCIVDRLALCLELLDISEVWLWDALGWDIATVSLASLRSGATVLSVDQWIAIAGQLAIAKDWLLYGHAPFIK